jgi:hypothetical protein
MHRTFPQIGGATVSVGSGLYSLVGNALPMVQFGAALVAIVAGIMSIISVVRHWKDK